MDSFIVVKGGSFSDIRKALLQWLELYRTDTGVNTSFKLYTAKSGNYVIKTSNITAQNNTNN